MSGRNYLIVHADSREPKCPPESRYFTLQVRSTRPRWSRLQQFSKVADASRAFSHGQLLHAENAGRKTKNSTGSATASAGAARACFRAASRPLANSESGDRTGIESARCARRSAYFV